MATRRGVLWRRLILVVFRLLESFQGCGFVMTVFGLFALVEKAYAHWERG